MAACYDYLTLTLGRGRPAWQGFADHLFGDGGRAIAEAGGEGAGLVSPQPGFHPNQAGGLVRWPRGAAGPIEALAEADDVVAWSRDELAPTVRPADRAWPRGGDGIFVHRWFVVDEADREAFVDLSGRAWTAFEGG